MVKQTLMISLWKQQNLTAESPIVRRFWSTVSGYDLGILDKMWPDVQDPMDIEV